MKKQCEDQEKISIHAPLTGCDGQGVPLVIPIDISIHAPLTGCDDPIIVNSPRLENFNPRTPDGVRLVIVNPNLRTV